MDKNDIRWEQRFSNYRKALAKMEEVVSSKNLSDLSDLEKEGLIQRFEYTYELAWKTLQDILKHNGHEGVAGPTPVLRQALKDGLINDGEMWRELKQSREATSHTYDSAKADKIAQDIYAHYFDLLAQLQDNLLKEISN